MSVKLFSKISKYTAFYNENFDNYIPKLSKDGKTLPNQQFEKNGMLIEKCESAFSGAALNLIVDNIASPSDVTSILEIKAKTCSYLRQNTKCEFCSKKCDISKICCAKKEQQMHLLNNALERLRGISNKKLSFTIRKIHPSSKFFNIKKEQCDYSETSLDALSKKETFRKIRKKLKNLKKYYPKMFYCSNSIIEEWGKNSFLTIKPEILKLDPKANSIFWV